MGTLTPLFDKIKQFGIRSDLLPKDSVETGVVIFMEATSPLWIDLFCSALAHDILPKDSFPSTGKVAQIIGDNVSCIKHWFDVFEAQPSVVDTDNLHHIRTMIQSLIDVLQDSVTHVFVSCQIRLEKYLETITSVQNIDSKKIVGYCRFYCDKITDILLQQATVRPLSRYILTNAHVMRTFYRSFYDWFWSTFFLEAMYIKLNKDGKTINLTDTRKQSELQSVNNFVNKHMHDLSRDLHEKVYPPQKNRRFQVPTKFDETLSDALASVIQTLDKINLDQVDSTLAKDIISQWLLFAVNAKEIPELVQGSVDVDFFSSRADGRLFEFVGFIPVEDEIFPLHESISTDVYTGDYQLLDKADQAVFWDKMTVGPMYAQTKIFTRPMHSLDAVICLSWMCEALLTFYSAVPIEKHSAENTHAKTVFAIQGLPRDVRFQLTQDEVTKRFDFDAELARFVKPDVAQYYEEVLTVISNTASEKHAPQQAHAILMRIEFHYQQLDNEGAELDDDDDEYVHKTGFAGLDALNKEFETHAKLRQSLNVIRFVDEDDRQTVINNVIVRVDEYVESEPNKITENTDNLKNELQYVENEQYVIEYADNYYKNWDKALRTLLTQVGSDDEYRRAIERKIDVIKTNQHKGESESDVEYVPSDESEDSESDDSMSVDESLSDDLFETADEGESDDESSMIEGKQQSRKNAPSKKTSSGKASVIGSSARSHVVSKDDKPKILVQKDIELASKEMLSRKNVSIAVVMLAKDIDAVRKLLYTPSDIMNSIFKGYQTACRTMKGKNYLVFDGSFVIVTNTPGHGILFSFKRLLDCVEKGYGSKTVNYIKTLTLRATNGMEALLEFPKNFSNTAEEIATGQTLGPAVAFEAVTADDFNVFIVPIPNEERARISDSVCVSCLLNKTAKNIDEWFIDEHMR